MGRSLGWLPRARYRKVTRESLSLAELIEDDDVGTVQKHSEGAKRKLRSDCPSVVAGFHLFIGTANQPSYITGLWKAPDGAFTTGVD
jgi:hypothetical protein